MKILSRLIIAIFALILFPTYVSAVEITEVFTDDFEINNFAANWNATADYTRDSSTPDTGSWAIIAQGAATDTLMNISLGRDLTSYDNCNLTARLQITSGMDSNEVLCLDYSLNGQSTWNRITGADGIVGDLCQDGDVDAEGAYRTVNVTITDTTGITDFHWRFRFTGGTGPEDGFIDNVNLNCTTIDLTKPRINASIYNVTTPTKRSVVNVTANVSDNIELDTCQFLHNGTSDGSYVILNKTFIDPKPTNDQCSQNISIGLIKGSVINFTVRVNDTSTDTVGGNKNQSEQIITVADYKAIVSIGINNSAPKINEVVNISSNATDLDDLDWCLIKHNGTSNGAFTNNTFKLSGTADFCSDPVSITLIRGNVINFTIEINDSFGDIIYENSTSVTVANTPAFNATILFPTIDFKTNKNSIDINITYPADPDNDVINISYYINGKLNQTQLINTTFNASDGVYILNVSLHDNVTPLQYSDNKTVNFTLDSTTPIVNTSLNKSFTNIVYGDVINLSANVTDNIGLLNGSIIINDTGFKRYFNFSLIGKTQFSQNITISCFGGCVINFTARVNDTAGNYRTNDTIITVVDDILPVVNTSLNKSSTNIAFGDVINLTANITDEVGLSFCQIIINQSGPNAIEIINISLEGLTSGQCSNSSPITVYGGSVINYTVRVNDTSNNFRTNDTIITVVDDIKPRINASIYNVTSPRRGDVVNFTANVSDEVALSFCQFFMNGTSDGSFIILNKTVTGQDDQCSQNWTIDLIRNNVINFTTVVNDTTNNKNQSEQIITVTDYVAIITLGLNASAPKINEVVNVSANVTDQDNLDWCLIKHNGTSNGAFTNNTFELSGTADFCSDPISITLIRGNVINFTIEINDSLGGIIYENSTKVTVANTPAGQATIVFPPNDYKANTNSIQLNITYPADPDNDVINISYYINGVLNQTQIGLNTTFNASDGIYILNVSLHDNVTPLEYSANVSVNFTIDTINPVVNATLNKSQDIVFRDVINLTANATDLGSGLSFGQIIVNGTGEVRYYNFSLDGNNEATFSQNITISCFGGCVINFTARVNDTAGNYRTNDTIITVVDDIKPRINASIYNVTSPRRGDVVNFTANVSDEANLDTCQFFMNGTSDGSFVILNKTVAGTNDQCSQNWTIDLIRNNVINFTTVVNDTTNNKNQSEQIITVADYKATVSIGLNVTNPKINDIVNVSSNATDLDDLDWCLIKHNGTSDGAFTNNTFELSGTADFCSDPVSITLIRGNVINFTIEINDSLGGIIYENSAKVTVANTPAGQATIVFPPSGYKANTNSIQLNITYPADPDNDVINISYYINGVLNQTQIGLNTTFNASDGIYILNVSLHDNVAPLTYSANVTINLTIDTAKTQIKASLNKSIENIFQFDVLNASFNASDDSELDTGQVIINDTGEKRYYNFTLSGLNDKFSQNFTISCGEGCVVNVTGWANDTFGNFAQNETLFTVGRVKNPASIRIGGTSQILVYENGQIAILT